MGGGGPVGRSSIRCAKGRNTQSESVPAVDSCPGRVWIPLLGRSASDISNERFHYSDKKRNTQAKKSDIIGATLVASGWSLW